MCVARGEAKSENPPTLLLTALGDLRGITTEMVKGHFKGQTWPLCAPPPAMDRID